MAKKSEKKKGVRISLFGLGTKGAELVTALEAEAVLKECLFLAVDRDAGQLARCNTAMRLLLGKAEDPAQAAPAPEGDALPAAGTQAVGAFLGEGRHLAFLIARLDTPEECADAAALAGILKEMEKKSCQQIVSKGGKWKF